MKISRIDHLGIGVESIDAVLPYFENVLGLIRASGANIS